MTIINVSGLGRGGFFHSFVGMYGDSPPSSEDFSFPKDNNISLAAS